MNCKGILSRLHAGHLLNRMKIKHKILLMTVLGIAALIALSMTMTLIIKDDEAAINELYEHKAKPLDKLRKIQLIFREIEFRMAAIHSDMMTGTAAANHLKASIKELDLLWKESNALLTSAEIDGEKEQFRKGYESFIAHAGTIEKAYMTYFYDNDLEPLEEAYDEWLDYKALLIKSIDRIIEIQEISVDEFHAEKVRRMNSVIAIVIIGSIVSIIIFVIVTFVIINSIIKPINTVVHAAREVANGDLTYKIELNSTDEMGTMAVELNSMIEKLNRAFFVISEESEKLYAHAGGLSEVSEFLVSGTNEQRMQVQQVATSTNDMSRAIVDMSKNACHASDITKESVNMAVKGSEVSDQTRNSISKLVTRVAEASEAIGALGKSSEEIGEIVSVIKDIADQTNLLALNAAIEAARAGEHGRGFAVVAGEVKKLAERTANATDEISQKIQINQNETKGVVSSMEQSRAVADEAITTTSHAGETLQKIVESSENVMDMVNRIAVATEEQSSAAEEVSHTMEGTAGVIANTNVLAENVKNVSAELTSVSTALKLQMDGFRTHSTLDLNTGAVAEVESVDVEVEKAPA